MECWAKLIVAGTLIQVLFLILTIREYRRHGELLRLIQNNQTAKPDDDKASGDKAACRGK